MGGADELDFTSKVADAVADKKRELIIVVGAGYEKKEELANLLDKKNIRYDIKVNVQDMLSEYLACDFAIGAGGLTSSELVASHTPCAFIATYEHQIARCEYFDRNEWGKYLGFRGFNRIKLMNAVNNFLPNFKSNIFNTEELVNEIRQI